MSRFLNVLPWFRGARVANDLLSNENKLSVSQLNKKSIDFDGYRKYPAH